MQRTQFAGLTSLAPGEPLATDGYSFQTRNPLITDQLLKVGAVTHKHDGHAALARPTVAPSASAIASGGIFPGDLALMIGYTVTDAQGGETLVSDVISVTTPPQMAPPSSPPSAAADYSGGSMRIDTYYYVKTWVDAGGGETTSSTYAQVARAPGFASGQIRFFNLASGMAAVGASGWKLYKSGSDGRFKYLASGTSDTFTDDGNICTDCVTPPPQTNTTQQHNRVDVVVPTGLPTGAERFRVYLGLGGGFFSPSLMGDYPIASAGTTLSYASYVPFDGKPPDVATTLVGANQIDPDTDILDWSWKRSVATRSALGSGAAADVRMVRDTRRLYTPSGASASAAAQWDEVPGNVRVAGSGTASAAALNNAVVAQTILFYGSGITVRSQSGSAIVDLSALATGSGGGGGGGGSGGTFGSVSATVTGVVNNAVANTTITLSPKYVIYRIQADRACRIRAYRKVQNRTDDASRAVTTAPTGDHGVVLDAETATSLGINPPAIGVNEDDTTSSSIPFAITNESGATHDITVTIKFWTL